MYPIEELPQEIYSILNNETQGAERLEGELLSKVVEQYSFEDPNPIYFTKTNLIITHEEESRLLEEKEPSLPKIARVFLPAFNTYCSVYSFVNCAFLNTLLTQGKEEEL